FFFFQAEAGIRDFHVTGVQTRALPISADVEIDFSKGLYARNDVNNAATTNQAGNVLTQKYAAEGKDGNFYEVEATFTYNGSGAQIGRASCRERGRVWGGEGSGNRRKTA